MTVVTAKFVERIIREGHLAEAQARARNGTACPKNKAQWDKFSSWGLICEEILDTENDSTWYDDVLAELCRRGFSYDQIDRMRAFAWQTAGWLNYDRMLWEWCSLDEDDIRTALHRQFKEGIITRTMYRERLSLIDQPCLIPPVHDLVFPQPEGLISRWAGLLTRLLSRLAPAGRHEDR